MEENNSISTSDDTTFLLKENRPKPYKKIIKICALLLILIGVVFGIFHVFKLLISPQRAIQQVYLVPKDAVFIIQSNHPVNDWKEFSKSKPWICLKKSPSFAEIAQRAETLDSIFQENDRFLSLIGKRDLLISAHKVRSDFWDFLYIIDLQDISEIKAFKEQIGLVYSFMNYKVTYRKHLDTDIIELKDLKTRNILYTAFVDNQYIASFSSKLVEASIHERNNPVIGLDPHFIEADKLVANKGLYRIFIHYKNLPLILEMYLGKENEYLSILGESMAYAGFSFYVSDEKIELKGYNLFNDTINPYVSALFRSGKRKLNAHKILSQRTAFYTNFGFDNPTTFLYELEKALSQNNIAFYNEYQASYKKIESMFGISLQDDFLSWMSGEFAVSELEPGLLGQEPEKILAIHTQNMEQAKEKMAYIEKKIKKRTPIHIKTVTYKNYDVNYVELKGFFALFFGKMFDKFEKPYYTYIGDYVIFSNKPSTILSFIEDYKQEYLLVNDNGFKNVISQVENQSTYFTYLNTRKFFPLLKTMLSGKAWSDLYANKEIAYSFPNFCFQIIGESENIETKAIINYYPFKEVLLPEESEIEETDEDINELNRFYAEKFQGNIYREFYPVGALKSECEIREGKRHGKYREYYENGILKIRGKYGKGNPKGTWNYYLEDGSLDKKVKM